MRSIRNCCFPAWFRSLCANNFHELGVAAGCCSPPNTSCMDTWELSCRADWVMVLRSVGELYHSSEICLGSYDRFDMMLHGVDMVLESALGSLMMMGWCLLVEGRVELTVPALPAVVTLAPVVGAFVGCCVAMGTEPPAVIMFHNPASRSGPSLEVRLVSSIADDFLERAFWLLSC